MTNTTSGVVSLSASANANGAGFASAAASANTAMYQEADAATVSAFMSNAGYVTATANAVAVASGTVTGTGATATTIGSAVAVAHAVGLGQDVGGTTGSATIVNSGVLNVGAHATAIGVTNAFASAVATGAYQETDPVAINFTNSGVMNVNAHALARRHIHHGNHLRWNHHDQLLAVRHGVRQRQRLFGHRLGWRRAAGGDRQLRNDERLGQCHGAGTHRGCPRHRARERADGDHGRGHAPVVTTNANPINGTIDNSGTLNVVAFASGGVASATFTTPTTSGAGTGVTTVTTTTPLSSAVATGIRVNSGVNNLTITNSGSINVDAITANGGDATAYGIRVTSNGVATRRPPTSSPSTTRATSSSAVDRWRDDVPRAARRSTYGGSEPDGHQPARGGGNIYGNIELQSDADTINVTDGETTFNGVINSACRWRGPTALALDNPAQSPCGVGTLNINNGGNFHLLIDAVDGPSYVFMDTLMRRSTADGTITFDLPPAAGGNGSRSAPIRRCSSTRRTSTARWSPISGAGRRPVRRQRRLGKRDRRQCPQRHVRPVHHRRTGGSLLLDFGCIEDDHNNIDLGLPGLRSTRSRASTTNGERSAKASSASSTSA